MPRLTLAIMLPALAFGTILLALSPRAAAAETPMTAEEFDAYVTGHTLTFGTGGVPYGVEQFKQGRRVLWAFIGEECREGVWYPQGEQICFVYEDEPRTHCWYFWMTDEGLRARFAEDGPGDELYEIEQSARPMFCPGPQIGA